MSRLDVELVARKCGITFGNNFADDMFLSVLTRFAREIACAERIECIKLCEQAKNVYYDKPELRLDVANEMADKIASMIRCRDWAQRKD